MFTFNIFSMYITNPNVNVFHQFPGCQNKKENPMNFNCLCLDWEFQIIERLRVC